MNMLWLCGLLLAPPTDSLDQDLSLHEIQMQTQVLHTDTVAENRIQAHQKIDSLLFKYLSDNEGFAPEIEGISRLVPKDNRFEIYTWQLNVDGSQHRYGGLIKTEEGKVFRLEDKASEAKPAHLVHLLPKNWHGALYYQLLDFKHEGETHYLLFGFHVLDFTNRRKVLEVLHFDKSGKPHFGKRVLESRDARNRPLWVSRLILDYSASSVCNLRYDEAENRIIFDHLVAEGLPEGPSAVTDGSYSAMELKKGKWTYIDMAYEYEYDRNTSWSNPTPPMEEKALFDQKENRRDLFGKKKKRKP